MPAKAPKKKPRTRKPVEIVKLTMSVLPVRPDPRITGQSSLTIEEGRPRIQIGRRVLEASEIAERFMRQGMSEFLIVPVMPSQNGSYLADQLDDLIDIIAENPQDYAEKVKKSAVTTDTPTSKDFIRRLSPGEVPPCEPTPPPPPKRSSRKTRDSS